MFEKHCCEDLERHLTDDQVAIIYSAKFREYGIKILNGGTAKQLIRYCPWCGDRLPSPLRDEWFRRLKEVGKEPGDDIPPEMESDSWWLSAGF